MTPEERINYQIKAFNDAYELGRQIAKENYENQR